MSELHADRIRQARQMLQDAARQGKLTQHADNRFGFDSKRRDSEYKQDKYRTNHKVNQHGKFLTKADIDKLQKKLDIGDVLNVTYGNQGGFIDLTAVDLHAFAENIKLLQNRFKQGITAKQVIDGSRPEDLKRANEQIKFAVPVSHKDGMVNFLTDASGNGKEANHHVRVEFIAFNSLIQTNADQKTARNLLNQGRLKFECDCGRHTYWYRYIATIGGYGCGRQENGYPKIRNPQLTGIACKHVLRVMDYIRSAAGIRYMWQQLQKVQARQDKRLTNRRDTRSRQEIERDLATLQSGIIKSNGKTAENALHRHAERIAKDYFRQQQKQRKALIRDLNKIAAIQERELNARRQAIAESMSEDEMAQVEALLRKLRGNK